MIINLKQVNLADSDNIKLDKINYNFDQLVANGGGPQGPTGSKGDTGAQGVTGARGFQGFQGIQGEKGLPGINTSAYWKNIQGIPGSLSADTIVPIHNPTTTPPSPAMDYPPVVSVGFVSTDNQYNTAQPLGGGTVPYQWIINRKDHFASNLRFTSSDVLNNYVDFRIENDAPNSVNRFIMKFGTPASSSFIWYAQNHKFKSNVTGNLLMDISDSSIEYNVDTEFNRPVTVKEQLIIGNSGAATDKIAVSADSSGKITFKSIKELGGVVPYGTIISILPSIFSDSSKFITSESVTLASPTDLLKIKVGSGLGDYEGWYVCNGKTWKGTIDHIVPDLNSFSYNIGDNINSIDLNSQGSAVVTNNETHIMGGADLSMTATNVAPGVYGVGSTITTTPHVSIDTTSGGSTYKIKRLPQIIYLGEGGCYWQDAGTGQAPVTTNTYFVDDLNNTATGSLTASTPRSNQQGSSDSFTIRVYSASGYYFNSLPGGGAFTATSNGYSIVSVSSGGGTYPTFVELTITATQGANNTDRYFTWNSSAFVAQIPQFTLALLSFTLPSNVTVTAPQNPITYNTAGYTFNLVVTANSGYIFNNVNTLSFTAGATPSGSTFTINSSTYTGIAAGHPLDTQQITLNVTLTGVPYGSSTVYYGLQGNPISVAPKVNSDASKYLGPNQNANPMSWESNSVYDELSIINQTGSTKYIYLSVNNFTTGGSSGLAFVGADWSGLSAGTASQSGGVVSSSTYITLAHGQTVTDFIDISSVGDYYYEVYLSWSNFPGGTQYIVGHV